MATWKCTCPAIIPEWKRDVNWRELRLNDVRYKGHHSHTNCSSCEINHCLIFSYWMLSQLQHDNVRCPSEFAYSTSYCPRQRFVIMLYASWVGLWIMPLNTAKWTVRVFPSYLVLVPHNLILIPPFLIFKTWNLNPSLACMDLLTKIHRVIIKWW